MGQMGLIGLMEKALTLAVASETIRAKACAGYQRMINPVNLVNPV